MPWFPDFANAAELARRSVCATGHADPVAQYLHALSDGDAGELRTVWPAEVVVHDPRAGEVRGRRHLRQFVRQNQSWLAERRARIETRASTTVGPRAVVELDAHLVVSGQDVVWPMAVVAESRDNTAVVFRTYCSQWPVDGRRHVRPPVLDPTDVAPGDVVGRHLAALAAGDVEALVATFTPQGSVREAIGPPYAHRGADELRAFYADRFPGGAGLGLRCCAVTDDGVRCAVEYVCDSWGGRRLPAQAGLLVCERAPDGLLLAARLYDDLEPAPSPDRAIPGAAEPFQGGGWSTPPPPTPGRAPAEPPGAVPQG